MKHTAKTATQHHPRKRMTIMIDAMTTMELKKALSSIMFRLHSCGDAHQRYGLNDILIEFEIETYGELDYRIELINGKLCYVYKSKL